MIAETGLAVSGPNCMGNVCAKTRFVTFPEDRMLTVKEGPVAMVGQSGGMMLFANGALNERGIVAEYLITSGNEAGLSVGDYIAFFADQPELKVIVIYVEAVSNLETFKAACRMARAAGKHIVALKLGQSEGGREAALAHTGSLAGSIEAFDAVAGEAGVVRADTLDDVVEMTELLAYTGAPSGRNLGAITLSGAFRGLLLDGAERNGLHFRPLEAATTEKLNAILGVGSLVGNPTDGGYGVLTSADNYINSIDAMQADPNVDIVLVQEQIPREAGSGRAETYVRLLEDYVATRAKKPIAFCAPTSHGHTDFSRALRAKAPHVSFLQEANKALRAIAAVARRDEMERLARSAEAAQPARTRGADGADRAPAPARRQRSGRAERIRIEGGAARLRHRDAEGSAGHLARRRARRRRAHRLSGRAQGGVADADAQVGRRRGRAQSRDAGAVARPPTSGCRRSSPITSSTACWSASSSAAGSNWCSACIATARWA